MADMYTSTYQFKIVLAAFPMMITPHSLKTSLNPFWHIIGGDFNLLLSLELDRLSTAGINV